MNQTRAGASRSGLAIATLATLVLLLAHAWLYRFLTDDAFISFRYARNLAHGHGLVFNPGLERVEGFSNLLWTLLLAGLDALGLAPERVAIPLGLGFTVALWAVIAGWMGRRWSARDRPLALVPLLFLALSRSFAVWSTSGLETRLFELLAIAGLLRLIEESESLLGGRPPGPPLAAWLLGLASLTRPDGALIAGSALLASAWVTRGRGQRWLRRALGRAWPWLALMVAVEAFRWAYYHAWVPNTYFAKVGGRLQWEAGLEYVAAFALEYAAFLWLPFLIAGIARLTRAGERPLVLILAAAAIPYGLYVIAIGGDHFEYRPLDLYFPLVALVMGEGLREWCVTRRGAAAAVVMSAVMLGGLTLLPWRSHREFPRVYSSGFPGYESSAGPEADRYLDPSANPITRLPLVREWAAAHRALLRRATARFAGVREEEHALFLAQMREEGLAIRRLVDQGRLPHDAFIATDCVGAVPYLTDLPTLDRHGLTDARVARQAFLDPRVAHGKEATPEYARRRGVDLWFHDPARLLAPLASSRFMRAWIEAREARVPVYAADGGSGEWLLAMLPRGADGAARRMPRLAFVALADSSASAPIGEQAIDAWLEKLASDSTDTEAWDALGYLHASLGHAADARDDYRALTVREPGDADAWINLGVASERLGDSRGAIAAHERAAALLEAAGEAGRLEEVRAEIARLERGPDSGGDHRARRPAPAGP